MGVITVRRLDDEVVERLKARAKASGRSMEEEARLILTEAAGKPRLSGQEAIEYFRRRREEMFGDRVLPNSLEVLREIRDEDPRISPPDTGYP